MPTYIAATHLAAGANLQQDTVPSRAERSQHKSSVFATVSVEVNMSATRATAEVNQKLPRSAMLVAVAGATLGLIYGYDNGNIGGAALFFQPDLHLNISQVETIASAILIGEILGAIIGGLVCNKFGRKKTILLIALGYTIFCIASAISWDMLSLGVSRFFLGLTIGLSLIAVPLFIAESVPARVRGRMLVLYQVMGVTGILLGNLIAAALTFANPSYNWRIMLGLAAVPAILLVPMLLKVPETANYLLMRGEREKAAITFAATDPDVDTTAQLADMEATLAEETGGSLKEMLKKPYLRATMFVLVFGFAIQITGINSTVTYGPQLFKSLGFTGNTGPIMASAAIQVFALASVLVSMRYIDRWGRRPILLTGIGVMTVGLVITAGNYATLTDGKFGTVQQIVGFSGLAIVQIGFVFGFGSLVWVYASEAFPGRLRAYGTSVLLTADLVANWIVAQFTLTALEWSGSGTFLVFAILCVLAFFFVLKFAPETKGRQLDDIRHYWENGGKWPEDMKAVGSAKFGPDKAGA